MSELEGLEKLTFVDGKKSYEQQFLTRFIARAKEEFRNEGFVSVDANIFRSGQNRIYCFGVRGNISIGSRGISLELGEYNGEPELKERVLDISNSLYDEVIDAYSLNRL